MKAKIRFNAEDPNLVLQEEHDRHMERRDRCRKLRLSPEEVQNMVKDFISQGGLKACPPAYAALSPQYNCK